MIKGGPCACCGATTASIWYGKKGADKFCKKADCLRAGGYLAPKQVKAGSAAAKRARAAEVKEEDDEVINLDTTISELIEIYGQRCAPPALPRSALPAAARARLALM